MLALWLTMKSFNTHMLAAVAAFVIWGFFSLLLKPMHIYPSLDIVFNRIILSGMLMGLLLLVFYKKITRPEWKKFLELNKKHQTKFLLFTFTGSLLLIGNWFFFVYTMNHISVKAASFAYLVCPILTTFLAWLIVKEKILNFQWLAIGLSALSCVLLGMNQFQELLYSLIVALSYALYLITQRFNQYLDKLVVLALQMIFAALVLIPFYPFFVRNFHYQIDFYQRILVMALCFTLLPLWLNLYALKTINSSTMGILLYINPLLNFIISVTIFKESISTLHLWAYSIIIISILLFNKNYLLALSNKKVT